ncbi:MAG: hypothetical protein WBW94_08660 [Anaerolineales bacterium]
MSIRENIEIYPPLDLHQFLEVLKRDYGLVEHPSQAGALTIDGLSFYSPRISGDHVSILGFNKAPIPDTVVQALVEHPELVPNDVVIRWTQEQELIFECTLGELRKLENNNPET